MTQAVVLPHARPASPRRGVALISALLIMVAIFALGVGSLVLTQSNLMMTENLVATSIARSNAEAGIDATIASLFASFVADGDLPSSLEHAPVSVLDSGILGYALAPDGYVLHGGGEVTLRILGTGPRDAEYLAEARVAFQDDGAPGGGVTPFDGVVIGCEGVSLTGSGRIDSYDSALGAYTTAGANANAVVRTTEAGAPVRLTGNAPIYGDVLSTGTFLATGSSSVYGDVVASGEVRFQANATYAGDVRTTGDVVFTNTGQVQGSVSANGSVTFGNGAKVGLDAVAGGDIAFNNTGARVGGDARAGGQITRGHKNAKTVHVAGTSATGTGPVGNVPVPPQACDPLGIDDVMGAFADLPSSGDLQTGYPRNRWELTPTGVRYYDETWNVKAWVDDATRPTHDVQVFGSDRTLVKTGDLNLGNGELRVTGGDVVLYVEGDLNLGTGGGAGLVIDPGSTLTVFVTGRTTMGSAVQMRDVPPVSTTGAPSFALYSSFTNVRTTEKSGVSIGGNARLSAAIYAPRSFVSVNAGGGMYGTARGKTVEVTGGGALHFDEALGRVAMGEAGSSPTSGEPSWSVRSRR